jgi:MFS family permease
VRPAFARLWATAFCHLLSFFLLLTALPLFARRLGLSDAAIGVAMGAFAVSAMLCRPPVGWAADRYGRRPFMLAGTVVFAVSALAYGASSGAVTLALVRLLHGTGMGLYPTAASAMVADLAPPARRAEFIGLFGAAGSLAMALGPITGSLLADWLGFEALFGAAAAVALVALGLTVGVRETLGTPAVAPFTPASALSRAALFPSVVTFSLMLTYGTVAAFMPLHAAGQGVNPGLFFLVYAVVLTAARGPAGRLSDRLGRTPVAAAGLAVCALALALIAGSASAPALALAGALYGLGHGTAQPSLMAWCVDRAAPAHRGRAMGTFFTALELGIALGAMSSGLAVARWGFGATFLANAGAALAGAALAATHRPRGRA